MTRFRTLGSLVLAELFVPNVRSFGWASDRVVLFRAARRDVPTSPFEANPQRGMPSAGIALSIKPTVLLCRFLTEH
jgi:hypothetical protein